MKKSSGFIDRYFSMFGKTKEIFALFRNQYEVIPALTPELKAIAYQLRYKVYCQEFGFEGENSAEMEQDEYDHHSTQILLFFKPLNKFIGCARFVHGQIGDTQYKLPLQYMTEDPATHEPINTARLYSENIAEVSRLAIDRDYRHLNRAGGSSTSTVRSSCALLALLLGVQAFAKQSNTKYMYAVVEKKLWNTMNKLKIPVRPLGEHVEHRGKRYPIMLNRDEIENIVPVYLRPICSGIEQKMRDMGHIQKRITDTAIMASSDLSPCARSMANDRMASTSA